MIVCLGPLCARQWHRKKMSKVWEKGEIIELYCNHAFSYDFVGFTIVSFDSYCGDAEAMVNIPGSKKLYKVNIKDLYPRRFRYFGAWKSGDEVEVLGKYHMHYHPAYILSTSTSPGMFNIIYKFTRNKDTGAAGKSRVGIERIRSKTGRRKKSTSVSMISPLPARKKRKR